MLRAGDDERSAGAVAAAGEDRSDLLRAIVAALPVGVTVQDAHGAFLLINAVAATQLDTLPRGLTDPSVATSPLTGALHDRRAAGAAVMQSGEGHSVEECISGRPSEGRRDRVLLTEHRPLRIGDETLLLSASVDITERKSTESELARRAYFDELTALPKRSLIESHVCELLQADGAPGRFALAFLDIDNFKHINDYYGHPAGDALLVKIAKRLTAELGNTGVLARISGDEFLALFEPVGDDADLAGRIEHLLQRLKAPFFIDDFEIFASASIGVSVYPDHGRSFEALRQNADLAMYQAKNTAKGGYAIFNDRMEHEAAVRAEQEQRLRLAILEKRFRCAFQPKVDIRTREIHGVEALVRLCDENGIIQGPGTFVELAVELGLIDELTHLVLAEIVGALDLINAEFGSSASISLNVAAKQAADLTFMRSLAAALQSSGCPQRFMVEVTEDALLRKQHFQNEILPMLREIGVRVSIDDFGTGYSSLSALADITADEVKIDRSFITDIHKRPRNQSILRAIESLSKSLGMTVIAEGVETFEELAYLQAATEIRYAQGYYFSRPLFIDEFAPAEHTTDTNRARDASRPPRDDRQSLVRSRIGR